MLTNLVDSVELNEDVSKVFLLLMNRRDADKLPILVDVVYARSQNYTLWLEALMVRTDL